MFLAVWKCPFNFFFETESEDASPDRGLALALRSTVRGGRPRHGIARGAEAAATRRRLIGETGESPRSLRARCSPNSRCARPRSPPRARLPARAMPPPNGRHVHQHRARALRRPFNPPSSSREIARSRRPRADLRALPPPTRIALKLLKHTDEIQPRQGLDVPPEAAMDPRLAAQRRDPAVGLPHGNPHRSIRRARRARARRALSQLAAAVRVRRCARDQPCRPPPRSRPLDREQRARSRHRAPA